MRLPIRIKVQALRRIQSLDLLIESPSLTGYMNFIMFNRLIAMAICGSLLRTTLRSGIQLTALYPSLPTSRFIYGRSAVPFFSVLTFLHQRYPLPSLLHWILPKSAESDDFDFRGFHYRDRIPFTTMVPILLPILVSGIFYASLAFHPGLKEHIYYLTKQYHSHVFLQVLL